MAAGTLTPTLTNTPDPSMLTPLNMYYTYNIVAATKLVLALHTHIVMLVHMHCVLSQGGVSMPIARALHCSNNHPS